MIVLIHSSPSVLLRWRSPRKTRPEPPVKEPKHRTPPPATPSWLFYPPLALLVLWLSQPFLGTAVGTAQPEPWPDREGYSAPWPEHQQLYPLQRPVERGLPTAPREQLLLRRLEALPDPGRPRRCEPYSRWWPSDRSYCSAKVPRSGPQFERTRRWLCRLLQALAMPCSGRRQSDPRQPRRAGTRR